MRLRTVVVPMHRAGFGVIAALGLYCNSDWGLPSSNPAVPFDRPAAEALPESKEAWAVVDWMTGLEEIPAPMRGYIEDPKHPGTCLNFPRRPALAASEVDRVVADGPWLKPHVVDEARSRIAHLAEVSLPLRASAPFRVLDPASGVTIEPRLVGAKESSAEVARGYVVYRGADSSGADVVHRVTADGTEDHFAFASAPEHASVSYQVGLGDKVAGLRLVANVLEFVDVDGAPRLRVAPPYLIDATGSRRSATLSVAGCAVDASPVAPWGRDATPPGSRSCSVQVSWAAERVAYPAMLDPTWQGDFRGRLSRRWVPWHHRPLRPCDEHLGRDQRHGHAALLPHWNRSHRWCDVFRGRR
jgi:hypothetical protein